MTAPEPTRDVDRALVEAVGEELGCCETLSDYPHDHRLCQTHDVDWTDLGCPVAITVVEWHQKRLAQTVAERDALRAVVEHRVVSIWQEQPGEISHKCACGFVHKHLPMRFGIGVDVGDCPVLPEPQPEDG